MRIDKSKLLSLIQLGLQAGVILGLISTFIFFIGYEYQLGRYEEFGILAARVHVDADTYVNFLKSTGIIFTSLVIVSAFKDFIIDYVEKGKQRRKYVDTLILTIGVSLPVALYGLFSYFISGQPLKYAWDNYFSYIVIIICIAVSVILVRVAINRDLLKKQNLQARASLKWSHLVIEGATVLVLVASVLVLIGAFAENIGRQSIRGRTFPIFFHQNKKYVVIQDQGDRLLAVELCEENSIRKNHYRFTDKTHIEMVNTIKMNSTETRYCDR